MSDRGQPSGRAAALERALKLAFGAVALVTVALVVLADWMVWDALGMGLAVVAALAPLAVTDGGAPFLDLLADVERGQAGSHRAEAKPRAAMTPLGVVVLVSAPLLVLAHLIAS